MWDTALLGDESINAFKRHKKAKGKARKEKREPKRAA
jgi:hypothetical protein